MTAVNPFTAKDHWLTVGSQHNEVCLFMHVCVCLCVLLYYKETLNPVCVCVHVKHFVNIALTCMLPTGDYCKLNMPILISQKVKFPLSPESKVCSFCASIYVNYFQLHVKTAKAHTIVCKWPIS